MKYFAQAVAYAVFAAIIGLFSIWPRYSMLAPDEAIISVSFSHAGTLIGECRQLSQEELNELPPNMRRPVECPRTRHALHFVLHLDEQQVFATTAAPSGIWQDGKSTIYRRLTVAAGRHSLGVGMNDAGGAGEGDVHVQRDVNLEPGQNLVIRFDSTIRHFIFDGDAE